MFRASLSNAQLWKNLTAAISTLIEEGDFTATPDGIKLRSMDPSHIAMVDFEWQKSGFEEYECQEATHIRINIASMLKLLKRISSDEKLELHYDEKIRKLNLTLKGKITRKFTMPTLDPGADEPPTPKITFNSRIKLATTTLKDIVEDVQAVSDNVRLETTQEKLTATAATELSSATIELEKASETLIELDVKEPSQATFNLSYLAEIVKTGAAASETVVVEFSSNMPIRVGYDFPHGRLHYYLAPRLEAD